jgi:RND family efflux transporter MFP subunit
MLPRNPDMNDSHRFRSLPMVTHPPIHLLPRAVHLACLLALLVILAACSPHTAGPAAETIEPAQVLTATVEPGAHHATEAVVGTVRARLRASLEPRISGRILQFHAIPGEFVEAGEVLVELDAREVQAQVEQSLARLQQTRQDLQRFEALLQQNAVTRAEFDDIQTRHTVAQAAVSQAETMLDHARVVAPFPGIVSRKFADVGDLAQPGRPLLEIEDLNQLRFEAHVPESLLHRIQLGDQLPVQIPTLEQEKQGTVAEITPFTDPMSRTALVKLDLSRTPGLRSGQFGRLLVPTAERAALRVPAAAVVQRGQLELVFVIQDNRAHLRLVRTGKHWGDEVEVVSGVRAGETIAVSSAELLRDGQPVTVLP